MPRSLVNGQYTPPVGTFGVTGSVISSTAYNAFVNDIGQEMTNSLAVQGETVWTANQNMGSNRIINVGAGVASTDAANISQIGALSPIGSVVAWPAATAPSNYLICNGAAISRATYASLFSLIGTNFGAGDGSTTFNIPNLLGRCVQGVGTASGGSLGVTLGQVGGNGNGTSVIAITNLPAHNHGVNDPTHTHAKTDTGHVHTASSSNHSHTITDPGHIHAGGASTSGFFGVGSSFPAALTAANTSSATTGISVNAVGNIGITVANAVTGITITAAATGITTQNAGSGTALNIMNPFLGLTYVIRVL